MRPRADGGAAFVPGPPFVGATRRGEGRAARGPAPARSLARSLADPGVCRSLLGRLWRRPGAARARPGRELAGRPGRRKALGPGPAGSRAGPGLRGRSWRAGPGLPPAPAGGGVMVGTPVVSARKPRGLELLGSVDGKGRCER